MTAQETKQMLLGKILSRPEKFQFVAADGRMWDNQTYCGMLTRTVLLNAGRQTYFDACAENGCDVVRVTVSGNPCPDCAVWENRLLSISGSTPGLPTVAEAMAAGLCHPNCTHSFVAVGDYVREEDFTEDGRPKEGLNSPGKEEKNDPETWKKYREKSAAAAMEGQPSGPGIRLRRPLTGEELAEVKEYTKSTGHREFNEYLRNGGSGDPVLDLRARRLNAAIEKSVVKEEMTLWRGISDPVGMRTMETGIFAEIPVSGFQSTSRSFETACGFAGNDGRSAVVYKITVPKGKRALDVSAVSAKPDEREILLPSAGKYRIDKVYYQKDEDGFIIRQIVEVTYE